MLDMPDDAAWSGSMREPDCQFTSFVVAPLVVGAVDKSFVDKPKLDLYAAVIDALWPASGAKVAGAIDLKTVEAFSVPAATTDPDRFAMSIRDALLAALSNTHLCLLDLTGVTRLRGVGQAEAANAIEEALSERAAPLLIITDSYPPAADSMASVIAGHPELVTLLSSDGRTSLIDGEIHNQARHAVRGLVADPLENLRIKLIQVPGWFPREYDGELAHVRNWYDATYAAPEIATLLYRRMVAGAADALVVVPGSSSWLADPAASAATSLGIDWFSPETAAEGLARLSAERRRPIRVFVILAVIDRGTVARQIQAELAGLAIIESLDHLAVLSTYGSLPFEGLRRFDDGLNVRYLLRIRQELVDYDQDTLAGVPNRPPSKFDRNSKGLSLYEFWDLVSMCGTVDEEYVPAYRPTAGSVPDVKGMLDNYGPWLATRLMNLIRSETHALPSEMLFVRPAENNSSVLTEMLQRFFDISVVAVPRRPWLLRTYEEDELIKDVQSAMDTEPWLIQLRKGEFSTIIALDEFTKTGGSLSRMQSILTAVSLRAFMGAVLFDMRPAQAANSSIRIKSLYRLPYELPVL
jgi:hypothetical protein